MNKSKKTTWESRARALAKQGLSAGKIASQLASEGYKGASRATVGRFLHDARGPLRARVAATPRPAQLTPPDRRKALYAAAVAAESWEELTAAELAILRHEEPEIDAGLSAGRTLIDVVAEMHGHVLAPLRGHLAELVVYLAENDREEAASMLEDALVTVRSGVS